MNTKMVLAVLAVCATVRSYASAQNGAFGGECPKIKTVAHLDIDKLSQGHWYEVKGIKLDGYTIMEPQCSKTTFGRDLSVKTEFNTANRTEYTLVGHLKHTDSQGGFNITYDNIVTSGELPYNFIHVEYDDFLVIFGCLELPKYKHNAVVGWILSRTPKLSENAEAKWEKKIEEMDILTFPSLFYYDVERPGCKEDEDEAQVKETPGPFLSTENKQTQEPSSTTISPVKSSIQPSSLDDGILSSAVPPAATGFTGSTGSQDLDWSSTTATPRPATIELVDGGERGDGRGTSWAYIRTLLAAQWGMLVALLLLGLLVVISALAVYRMLLPFLRARQHADAQRLVFDSSEIDFARTKRGHYNDGLEV